MKRQVTIAKNPQQNGVAERENKSVQQLAGATMTKNYVQQRIWAEEIHTTIFILNKSQFQPNSDKNPYYLWCGRTTIFKHFKIFANICQIKRNDEKLQKFDGRVDEGIFMGYSKNNKGYKCYNKFNKIIID